MSNVKFVETQKENKELKAQLEISQKKAAEVIARSASLREEADRAGKLGREAAEGKRRAKEEGERSEKLRKALGEALAEKQAAEARAAAAEQASADAAPPPQLDRLTKQLEGEIDDAKREASQHRSELLRKSNMLVEMGEQLKATLTANAALQQDHASLTTEVERLRGADTELQLVQAECDRLAAAVAQSIVDEGGRGDGRRRGARGAAPGARRAEAGTRRDGGGARRAHARVLRGGRGLALPPRPGGGAAPTVRRALRPAVASPQPCQPPFERILYMYRNHERADDSLTLD